KLLCGDLRRSLLVLFPSSDERPLLKRLECARQDLPHPLCICVHGRSMVAGFLFKLSVIGLQNALAHLLVEGPERFVLFAHDWPSNNRFTARRIRFTVVSYSF